MNNALLNSREYNKNLLASVLYLFGSIAISFFSYDYMFYFVLAVNIIYVLLFLYYRNPIYILYLFVFSAFFDINGVFTFGGQYYLRIWYVTSFCVLIDTIIRPMLSKKLFIIKKSHLGLLVFFTCVIYLSGVSLLSNTNKMDAFLYVSKIYLFYIPVALAFLRWADKERIPKVMHFFLFMTFWVSLYGIFESATNVYGIEAIKYGLFSYKDVRPHGFFSETTWMGVMSAFGMIISFWAYSVTSFKKYIALSIPMIIVVFLSATRAAYIALVVAAIILLIFGQRKDRVAVFAEGLLFGFVVLIALAFKSADTYNPVSFTYEKFTVSDASCRGRIEGITRNLQLLKSHHLFTGLGFGYNEEIRASSSVIGAKSFNLFFAVINSLGILGLIVFLIGIFLFLVKYVMLRIACAKDLGVRGSMLYGLTVFIAYLVYTQISPLHLHVLGWIIVSISIAIYCIATKRYIHYGKR